MPIPFRKRSIIVGVVSLSLVGVGGAAYAAGAASNNIIKACAKKAGGDLRVAASCTSAENSISWNIQGPQGLTGPRGDTGAKGVKGDRGAVGPAGAQGPAGSAGPAGPAGASGPVSGYEIVRENGDYTPLSSGSVTKTGQFAACPAGKVAVGGGGDAEIFQNGGFLEQADLSGASPADDGHSWEADFSRFGGGYFSTDMDLSYTVWAVCVNGTA